MKRRKDFLPDLYVVARILIAIKDGATSRGRAAAAAGVSYDNLVRYLEYLKERGLVDENPHLSLTPRGYEFLEKLNKIIEELLQGEMELRRRRSRRLE